MFYARITKPDFLGQVVLTGEGRSMLPVANVEYPLTRKLSLPNKVTLKDAWRMRFDDLAADAAADEVKAGAEQLARYTSTMHD